MKTQKMILGLDFGLTVVDTRHYPRVAFPNAIRVIRRLVKERADKVYIISKVNETQKESVENWIQENDFFAITGIPSANIRFCAERKEKGEICRVLGVTHHIDDRPEVMAHLNKGIKKYLFQPESIDVVTFFNVLKNTKILHDWLEIEKELI